MDRLIVLLRKEPSMFSDRAENEAGGASGIIYEPHKENKSDCGGTVLQKGHMAQYHADGIRVRV
jgi:hypothetical protein